MNWINSLRFRGVALLASAALVVTSVPHSAAATIVSDTPPGGVLSDSAVPAAQAPTIVRELTEKRTATSREYLLSNGLIRAQYFSGPINYRDKNTCRFVPIDATLRDAVIDGRAVSASRANAFSVRLPKTLDREGVSLETSWCAIEITPARDARSDETLATTRSVEWQRTDGASGSYPEAFSGTRLDYVSTPEGLKETLVLTRAPRTTAWAFDLALTGLTPRLERDGSVSLSRPSVKDADFFIPAPSMSDSSGARDGDDFSPAVHYELSGDSPVWRLRVVADAAWLADPARVYPVMIDPSVTTSQAITGGLDTYVSSRSGYQSTNFVASTSLWVDNHDPAADWTEYAYVRPTAALISDMATKTADGYEVVSARLKLLAYDLAHSGSIAAGMCTTATYSNLATVTWNARPGGSSAAYGSGYQTAVLNWNTVNVTTMTAHWQAASVPAGYCLASLSGSTAAHVGFRSGDYSTTTNRPKWEIDYAPRPQVTLTCPTSGTVSAVPTATWTYTEALSNPQAAYELEVTTDTAVAACAAATATTDATAAAIPAPPGGFVGRQTYFVRVRAASSPTSQTPRLWSEWSAWGSFTFVDPVIDTDISSDSTLGPETVWIVDGQVHVASAARLYLEPGTVLKFKPSASLIVSGSLTVAGTAASPVSLTAWTDDTVGGDTNGDGGATAPTRGYWGHLGVVAGSGHNDLTYTNVAWGGGSGGANIAICSSDTSLAFVESRESTTAGVAVSDAAPSMIRSKIHHNSGPGASASNGPATIRQCELTDNDGPGEEATGPALPSTHYSNMDGNKAGGYRGPPADMSSNYWGLLGAPIGGIPPASAVAQVLYSSVVQTAQPKGGPAAAWATNAVLSDASPIYVRELIWPHGNLGGASPRYWGCTACAWQYPGCMPPLPAELGWGSGGMTLGAFSKVFVPYPHPGTMEDNRPYPGAAVWEAWIEDPAPQGVNVDEIFTNTVIEHYDRYHGGLDPYFLSDEYMKDSSKHWKDGGEFFGIVNPCDYGLEPVNLSTGNFVTSATDMSRPGKGPEMSVSRTYNALDADSDGALGHGWTAMFSSAACPGPDDTVVVVYPDGRRVTFSRNESGGYDSPSGVREKLSDTADGFSLLFVDGTVRTYSGRGMISSERDRWGNAITYTPSGLRDRVATMTAGDGRYLRFVYDSSRRLVRITDDASRTVRYEYDAAGDLRSVTGVDGQVTKYTYDSAHRLLTAASPKWPGKPYLSNHYDASDRIDHQHDAYDSTATLAYDATDGITTQVDNRGHTILNFWDPETKWATGELDAASHATSKTYDSNGFVANMTNGRGLTVHLGNDESGNTTSALDPRHHETQASYDSSNNLVWSEDALHNRTTYTWDAAKRNLVEVCSPAGTVTFTHRSDGLVSTAHSAGATTTFDYDSAGRLSKVIDPLEASSTIRYDAFGYVAEATDAQGRSIETSCDTTGRVLKITDSLENSATFGYDENGNRTSATDAESNVTTFSFDAMDLISGVKDAEEGLWTYTHDRNYNLSSVTNAASHTTSYTYTADDELEKTTDPLGHSWTFTREGNGNLIRTQSPNGVSVEMTYTDCDLISRTEAASGTLTYDYIHDAAHHLTSVEDVAGRESAFDYDGASRIKTTTDTNDGHTFAIRRGYDAAGRTSSVRVGQETSRAYQYDLAGRPATITLPSDPATAHTTYSFDDAGLPISRALPDGSVTSWDYDAAGRLTSLVTTTSSGVIGFSYTRDANGRVTAENSATFAYDNLGRLTTWYDPTADKTTTYAYDAVSNLTGVSVEGSLTRSFTFDAADRISTSGFAYDAAGNMTCDGNRTFAYDGLNRLSAVLDSSGTTIAAFAYDAFNRRVSSTEGTRTTFFHYDGASPDVVAETDADGVTLATYSYDAAARLHSMTRAGATYYYVTNAHGDVVALTDESGAVVNEYRYDPWGKVLQATETVPNPYRYASYRYDSSTGLYHLWNRYYDAQVTCRFLTRDLYPGELTRPASMNPYAYCEGDPVSKIDPTGTEAATAEDLALTLEYCVVRGRPDIPVWVYLSSLAASEQEASLYRADRCRAKYGGAWRRVWANPAGDHNAFRHAYWSALISQRYGSAEALQWTTAHEGLGAAGSPQDYAMDMKNNALGAAIGSGSGDASASELSALIHGVVQRGGATVLDYPTLTPHQSGGW
jgi:RHS repeat-associated protein